MDKSRLAYTIVVAGVVQGVGFRYFTKQEATSLSLRGTVENQQDATVLIFVEGQRDAVMQFLSWCHDGPKTAKVSCLDYKRAEPSQLTSFDIIR